MMMMMMVWSSHNSVLLTHHSSLPVRTRRRKRMVTRHSSSSLKVVVLLSGVVGIQDIAEIAHNKVLVAAALSAAIGQLSKPFTSALFNINNNKKKNKSGVGFRSVFQSGGFPSSHSSAVVATATSLALERGFSDLIFGLAVVYAGIVMYDAQGVRREVGTHAKALNRVLLETTNQKSSSISSSSSPNDNEVGNFDHPLSSSLESGVKPKLRMTSGNTGSSSENGVVKTSSSSRLLETDALKKEMTTTVAAASSSSYSTPQLLKESVGHTLTEVIAGGLLGFFVSLVVCTTI